MTERERKLAIIVGGLVVLFVIYLGWTKISAGFEEKNQTVERLQKQLLSEQTIVTQGALARKAINEYAARSLPSNIEAAKTTYTEWLIKFSAASNLRNAKPTTAVGQIEDPKKPFTVLTYQLEGEARLDDIVKLLYDFYSHPYLHKITGMNLGLKEKADYGVMQIKLGIAVAVIKDASDKQPSPKPEDYKLLVHSVDEYLNTIAQRNIFHPANRPPNWSKTASTSTNKGSTLNYELDAKDPDEKQNVKYELLNSTADGLRIDGNKLVWSPKEVGKFEATVRAIDSGLPSASSTQTIAINVAEPPPPPPPEVPKPKFDVATQTRVTGLVSGSKGPEAWFTSRTEGKVITVRVGDEFDFAGIKGKVTEIGASFVELETEGRKWIIGLDESLADAFKRGQTD